MEPSELVVAGLMIGAAGIGLLRAITRRSHQWSSIKG